MGIMEQAMKDIQMITSDLNDFAVEITISSNAGHTANISAIYSDHTTMYDENGLPINGKKTNVSFSELLLTAVNFPTRNQNGIIAMLGFKVTISYQDGRVRTYIVDDVRPDYSVNLITLLLSEWR